jgi:hypothetical protein
MVGSSVACPRNHFHRTLEHIGIGHVSAPAVLVGGAQTDHGDDIADQLDLKAAASVRGLVQNYAFYQ